MPPKPTLPSSGGNQCGGLDSDFLPRDSLHLLTIGWSFSGSPLFLCCWNTFDDYQCGWQDAHTTGNIPGLTPSDATCKRWSTNKLVCDNYWLGIGCIHRPWDFSYYYTPVSGVVDLGCYIGNVNSGNRGLRPSTSNPVNPSTSEYTVNRTLEQACGDVIGHREVHYKSGTGGNYTWDGADVTSAGYTKTNINSVRLYYMNIILGIPGSTLPFPVTSDYPWWIFTKPAFDRNSGATGGFWNCVRSATGWNGFGTQIIGPFDECIGCPSGFTEQNIATSKVYADGIHPSITVDRNGTNGYTQTSSYDLTGTLPTTSADNRPACYLPVIGPTCPPHSTVDGSGLCQPDCVGPKCSDPSTYNPTTHNCESAADPLWLYPQYVSWCRGVSGKKYFATSKLITDRISVSGGKPFTITFYDDSRPEVSAGTLSICTQAGDTTACASIFCPPGSDILQIFFIRGRPDQGQGRLLDTFEICYLESRDSGRSVNNRITNLAPYPAPFPAQVYNDATMVGITSSVTGNTVSQIQTIDRTGYDKIRPIIEKSGRLVLFCYRNNNWYCRVGYQDQVARTWTLSVENLVCSTKDYTWEQLSENPDGSFEFYFYNDIGKLVQLKCKAIAPDGAGNWSSVELLDASGTGLEYYTVSALHDKQSLDGISLLFWTPNQRGPVDPTTFTNLGKMIFRTIVPGNPGVSFPATLPMALGQDYILNPENIVATGINWNAMGTIRKRRDRALEHQGVGLYKRTKDLSIIGAGNWGNTN